MFSQNPDTALRDIYTKQTHILPKTKGENFEHP